MAYNWNELASNSANYGKISYYLWDNAALNLQQFKNSTTGSNTCTSLQACGHHVYNFNNKASVDTANRGNFGNHGDYGNRSFNSDRSDFSGNRGSFESDFSARTNYDNQNLNFGNFGDHGNNCCITSGTDILVSLDGQFKKIDEMQAGDSVIAYNFELNELVETCIEKYSGFIVDKVIKINLEKSSLTCTDSHPIYTDHGWSAFNPEKAKQFLEDESCILLEVGLKVLTKDGNYEEIISIEEIDENTIVFNPIIRNYHNYFANGLLVHNKQGE